VIVEGRRAVLVTRVVIQQPASSTRMQSVILATKTAAAHRASLLEVALSAEQAPELVILKKLALELQPLALLMLRLLMVRLPLFKPNSLINVS